MSRTDEKQATSFLDRYEAVIGLEVHVELGTKTKLFCGCATTYGAEPNTQVCPICLGMPGALPQPNRQAVEYGMRAALALGCRINEFTKFDRKHYHYPDLPNGYQISQFDQPMAEHGGVWIPTADGGKKKIGIRRIHLENDAGKSIHDASAWTQVDLNRAGVPLIEIVSDPDIRSAEEARLYLTRLRTIILYTGVSDVKMEEGSLRCDANISVRPKGSTEFTNLVEIKNMNSFRSVVRALNYEFERQAKLYEEGEQVVRETRHWDESRGITWSSRSKEEAQDYRYFPEADLVPIIQDSDWVERIRASLPELPDARQERYIEQYGLPAYDAGVLVEDRPLADFFEEVVAAGGAPKAAANWLMGDLLAFLNAEGKALAELPLTPGHLSGMLKLMDDGVISGKIAKDVFEKMCRTGKEPKQIVEEEGLVQISDTGELMKIIDEVLVAQAKVVDDYKGGKASAFGFLVGQVMKATRGKANPQLVNQLLRERLDG